MKSGSQSRHSCSSSYSEQLSDSVYDYSSNEDDPTPGSEVIHKNVDASHEDPSNPEREVFYVTGEESMARTKLSSRPSFGMTNAPRRVRVRRRKSRKMNTGGCARAEPIAYAPPSDSSLISDDSGLSSHSGFSNPPVPDRNSRIRSGYAPVRESEIFPDEIDLSLPVLDDNAPVYENCRKLVDYTSIYGNLIIDTFYELLQGGSLGLQKIEYGRKKIRMALKFASSLELTQDDMLNRERIKTFAKSVERRLTALRSDSLLEFRHGCDEICSILNRIKHLEEDDLNRTLSWRLTRGIRRVFTINRK